MYIDEVKRKETTHTYFPLIVSVIINTEHPGRGFGIALRYELNPAFVPYRTKREVNLLAASLRSRSDRYTSLTRKNIHRFQTSKLKEIKEKKTKPFFSFLISTQQDFYSIQSMYYFTCL